MYCNSSHYCNLAANNFRNYCKHETRIDGFQECRTRGGADEQAYPYFRRRWFAHIIVRTVYNVTFSGN